MRAYIFILLLLTFIPPAFAQNTSYICPMHPHISGDEGENCPICGMTLVPKVEETSENSSVRESHGDVTEGFNIESSYVHLLGVKTAEVTHHEFGKNIRSFGRIVSSTRLEHKIDVRTKGWIVDLETDAVGDTVKVGDLLFNYYSPQLMEAQSDFFLARKRKDPESRLRLFGMSSKAIADLRQKGKFLEKTPFYAPVGGTITKLNVSKGSHIQEGGSAMTIQNFSKVWVNADVSVRDVQFLQLGTPASITVPETGKMYESVIDFIHPINDPKSRTTNVRLILDNPNGDLRPDTYVDTVFDTDIQSRLAVPVEAVLYSSMGAYVMENIRDGYFKPLMVETGITANGLTEITSGLSHGQNIVTSGQFMLDAESNLRGGMEAMGHDHGE